MGTNTSSNNRASAILRQPPPVTTALRLTMPFALLLVICIWLGLTILALLHYQQLQHTAQQRLTAEIDALTRFSVMTATPMSASDNHVFRLDDDFPKPLRQRLSNGSAIISLSTARQLNWQKHGVHSEVLAAVVPDTQPPLIVAIPIAKQHLQKTFMSTGILLSLVIFVLMLLLGFALNARITRRLRYIGDTANAIMHGDLQKRIPINPAVHDEYSRLAMTLNAMLDKIAQLMQELRQVNSNIAHDLKSPLNRMRSRMEVALMNSRNAEEYQQALANSIADVDTLLQTFQALLLMGNLQSNARNYQLKTLSLSALAMNLGELYTALADEKQHQLQMAIQPDIRVFANPSLLSQALSNLLDNAIKYTPAGGCIRFSVSQTANMALIVISDNGSGIPTSERENVFKPFTRLDAARQLPGTGLGMSLVHAILSIHQASIQLHDNQPGLRVEIRLRTQP